MRIKQVGNKRDSKLAVVQNADTVTIPRGTPLVLTLANTVAAAGDGLSVVLPSTAGASNSNIFGYGVAIESILVNAFSESIVAGYVAYALVTQLTRSASSAVWPSSASLAAYAILQLDILNNAFQIVSVSQAAQNYQPFAVLLDSISSVTTQASTSSGPGTVTASIVAHRVFVNFI